MFLFSIKQIEQAFSQDQEASEFKKLEFLYKYYFKQNDLLKASEMAFSLASID